MSLARVEKQVEITPESLWPEVQRRASGGSSWMGEALFGDRFGSAMSVVERAFGRPLPSDGTQILTTDALTREGLAALFERRISALHVPGFCTPESAESLCAWVMARSGIENWKVSVFRNGVAKVEDSDTSYGIGIPFGLAVRSREDFVRYFQEAGPLAREMRTAAGGLSPIDRLRLDLDEAWPKGARIARFRGLRRALGLARVMTPTGLFEGVAKTEGMVHVDTLPVQKKGAGRFSANVYVHMPPAGGELSIYSVSPTSMDLLRNFSLMKNLINFDASAQEMIRSRLPPPITLRPAVGDLILLDTSRPHAVRGFSEGYRVTIQCWVDYDAKRGLALYS